jgi:DNA-binding response OmpR family regulator
VFEVPENEAMPEEPDHDGPERRDRTRRKARSGTRVLVIDDSPTIVALLKRMLQQNQLEVLEAFDAESGIEVARREVPDLIFLDIVLPGMDGFRALRMLRRDPITKHLPIIMISGNAQATEQFYVQRIGADDFMKKPFSRAEVFNRVEALLDEQGIPRHTVKPGTRAEAAEAAAATEA